MQISDKDLAKIAIKLANKFRFRLKLGWVCQNHNDYEFDYNGVYSMEIKLLGEEQTIKFEPGFSEYIL